MSFDYLYSIGRQAFHEFQHYGKKAANRLIQTPLPRLFVFCMALLLLLVLLPLVVGLFVFFVLLKIVFTLIVIAVRNYRKRPQQLNQRLD
jgi:Flp pilus assembly protein TadB